MSKKVDKIKLDFSALAEQWLASVSHGVKESTLAHYDYTLQRYLLPVFGAWKVHGLDEQRLEQGMLEVISPKSGNHKPLGASSARECLSILRRICKYAAHLRLMRPVEILVKLPQFERVQTKPLSVQEQACLRDFVLEHPTTRKAGLLLQMQLGLRIGEVCGLQWGDFDLSAGVLTIRRTVSRIYCRDGHTKVLIQTPKTRSSGREIPIPQELFALLQRLHGGASEEDLVPLWQRRKNRWSRAVTARVCSSICGRQLCGRCIPTRCGTHFATTCLQAGCDIKTLSELLGHADPNITLRRYVHSNMNRKRRELERVFAAVWAVRIPLTVNMAGT